MNNETNFDGTPRVTKTEKMNVKPKHKDVLLSDIRPNPLNFRRRLLKDSEFEKQVLEEAHSQLLSPLTSPIEVYEDPIGYDENENPLNDGKRYTIISGEKRWRGALHNYEQAISRDDEDANPYIYVSIQPKPKEYFDEVHEICKYNNQDQVPKKILAKIINKLAIEILKEEPTIKHRELQARLGYLVGRTDKTARNYIANIVYDVTKGRDISDEELDQAIEDVLQKNNHRDAWCNRISEHIKEELGGGIGAKISVSKKNTFSLKLSVKNLEDLQSLLSICNLEAILPDLDDFEQ